MRTLVFISASLLAATGAQATQSAEQRTAMRDNRVEATATARNISRERDPEVRGASCHVFLSLSMNAHRSRAVGYNEAAMERARSLYYADVVRRLGGWQVADQLIGSSANPLEPALPAARDAASRWCVQHAPPRVLARRRHR